MDNHCINFIELLDSFVNEKDPYLNLEINWEEINHLAKIHNVSGIVGYMADKLPQKQKPEIQIQKSMSDTLYSTIAIFTNRTYAMQMLMQIYEEHHIPCLLMKGYVVREYYPVPELRTFGDIDFLIKQEDRERSHKLMIELGYKLCESGSEAVWSYKKGIEYYEIHTHVLLDISHLNENCIPYFEDVWNYAIPYSGLYMYRFIPEFEFIYLFLHMSKHFSYNGAGIRMFLDMVLFVKHHSELDKIFISGELKKLGLYSFLCAISELCRKWFKISLPVSDDISVELTCYQELSDYILSGGVFGFYDREEGTPIMRLEYCKGASSDLLARLKFIWLFLFPPYKNMKTAYPFLSGKPYLLPVGWIYRIFSNIFRGRLNVVGKQVNKIKNSDTDNAKRQFELFKSIGLANIISKKN